MHKFNLPIVSKNMVLAIVFLWDIALVQGQISILPVSSNTEQFFLQQAININVINTSINVIKADLDFVLNDINGYSILSISKPGMSFNSGTNQIEITLTNNSVSNFRFGNNHKAEVLRNTGVLPFGQYNLCYFLKAVNSTTLLAEYCEEKNILPFAPPELVQPYNYEEVNTLMPILSWKPPMPLLSIPITYLLYLTEIKLGQSPQEAVERNRPLINRKISNETQMIYPNDAFALEGGKSYAWRISAFSGEYCVGTTETWAFQVAAPKQEEEVEEMSYSLAKPIPDGNYYFSQKGRVYFAFDNRLSDLQLQYKITPINDIKRGTNIDFSLPEIELSEGMNKIILDLSASTQFIEGSPYIIEIKNKGQVSLYVEFIYKK